MIRERYLNALTLALFVAIPFWAISAEEPFTITLMTRAVVFAIAAVGLNIALGLGGLVSLGHAVFFGLGGYAWVSSPTMPRTIPRSPSGHS